MDNFKVPVFNFSNFCSYFIVSSFCLPSVPFVFFGVHLVGFFETFPLGMFIVVTFIRDSACPPVLLPHSALLLLSP